jgi:hypothetical protein
MTTQNTYDVFQRAGMAHRLGFGQAPALLVVDMQLGLIDPEQSPQAANLDHELIAINRLIATV